jgi:hypothetical protein
MEAMISAYSDPDFFAKKKTGWGWSRCVTTAAAAAGAAAAAAMAGAAPHGHVCLEPQQHQQQQQGNSRSSCQVGYLANCRSAERCVMAAESIEVHGCRGCLNGLQALQITQ